MASTTTTKETPPDTLESARVRLGWTQDDLARVSDNSVRTVSRGETGDRPASFPKAKKIAAALQMPSVGAYYDAFARTQYVLSEREKAKRCANFKWHKKGVTK